MIRNIYLVEKEKKKRWICKRYQTIWISFAIHSERNGRETDENSAFRLGETGFLPDMPAHIHPVETRNYAPDLTAKNFAQRLQEVAQKNRKNPEVVFGSFQHVIERHSAEHVGLAKLAQRLAFEHVTGASVFRNVATVMALTAKAIEKMPERVLAPHGRSGARHQQGFAGNRALAGYAYDIGEREGT